MPPTFIFHGTAARRDAARRYVQARVLFASDIGVLLTYQEVCSIFSYEKGR